MPVPVLDLARLTVAAAAALTVAACGVDTPDVDDRGAVGTDEPVTEDIKVLQAQLEYPLDGVYDVGEDAELFFGIANTGRTGDELIDVRGPDFSDATLMADGETGVIPVPEDDDVYVGAEGAPSVLLKDLQTSLRSSQSIPVTFVFEEAGEVTLEAMVSAEGQQPIPPFDFEDPAEDPTGD